MPYNGPAPDGPKPPASPAPPPFRSRRDVSDAQVESRRRQAMIEAELTTAIQRAHEQDSNVEILEVVAALLAQADRWLKREMADDLPNACLIPTARTKAENIFGNLAVGC